MPLKKALFFLLWLAPAWGWSLNHSGLRQNAGPEKKTLHLVRQADSLFATGQYAAAIPLYRGIVWQHRQASAQLLMKLAYAQQQQNQDTAALLSLSMAQARQPRLDTWRQLVAIATRLRLMGYPSSWQQELQVQAQRYYYPVLQALLLAAVLVGVGLLLRRQRLRWGVWLSYGSYVGMVWLYLHWLPPSPAAIVMRPGAALMAGPGAGAAWLSTAAIGDRLLVLDQQDIWCRVRWQQRIAFIRAADLVVIGQ